MSDSTWADASDRVLAAVFAAIPSDASEADVRAMVRDAYPFGPRRMWPYKAWCARVRVWMDAWRNGRAVPVTQHAKRRDMHEVDHATLDMFGGAA